MTLSNVCFVPTDRSLGSLIQASIKPRAPGRDSYFSFQMNKLVAKFELISPSPDGCVGRNLKDVSIQFGERDTCFLGGERCVLSASIQTTPGWKCSGVGWGGDEDKRHLDCCLSAPG